jgi:hypothetical protein
LTNEGEMIKKKRKARRNPREIQSDRDYLILREKEIEEN